MTMPYLPEREIWVDISFFQHNMEVLQNLQRQGVECHAKKHTKYALIKEIITYETTRDPRDMINKTFIGRMGLSGFFALHLATKEDPDRIFLLGYDFGSTTNKTHYYQDNLKVDSSGIGKPILYRDKTGIKAEVKDFENFANLKAKVYNVSPESAIPCFEKIDYNQFFTLLGV
jgi:hypothetical protein